MQCVFYYLPYPDDRIYNVVDIVLRVNPADKLLLNILNALYDKTSDIRGTVNGSSITTPGFLCSIKNSKP